MPQDVKLRAESGATTEKNSCILRVVIWDGEK